jgi:hypothetical protein
LVEIRRFIEIHGDSWRLVEIRRFMEIRRLKMGGFEDLEVWQLGREMVINITEVQQSAKISG